jgi:hypothetical protein
VADEADPPADEAVRDADEAVRDADEALRDVVFLGAVVALLATGLVGPPDPVTQIYVGAALLGAVLIVAPVLVYVVEYRRVTARIDRMLVVLALVFVGAGVAGPVADRLPVVADGPAATLVGVLAGVVVGVYLAYHRRVYDPDEITP